jgi:hypothetical protein
MNKGHSSNRSAIRFQARYCCNRIAILCSILLISSVLQGQQMKFTYEPAAPGSGFRMEGYWVWCGSMIKVGSTYHLFASRWPKSGPFPEGYRQNSEIVRATSGSPTGPFVFREVVIGERDSSFWDSNMAHNPTIQKIGNEYVLFYIGSDFITRAGNSGNLLRRIGYATAKSITGPWKRSDEPIIYAESNNPAILKDGKRILLVYRDASLKVYAAAADNFRGKYEIINEDLWPSSKIEDFFIFKDRKHYHIICEDNTGGVSGHVRWGVHLWTDDPRKEWKKYDPVIVYDHNITFTDDSVLKCTRRERPQLLITNNHIDGLVTSVYVGNDSWSQPLLLKKNIRIR